MIARPTPYWAVIFTSKRRPRDDHEYDQTAGRMETLAASIPGHLGIESVRDANGIAITVSYWESEDSIAAWRDHPEHLDAKSRGRGDWYEWYELRVARVDRARSFRL